MDSEKKTTAEQGGRTSPEGKVHTDSMQDLPFFDNTPGLTPAEKQSVDDAAAEAEKRKTDGRKRRKERKTRARRRSKRQGVFMLPVYMATYNCYNECRFRFRTLPAYARGCGQDILERLLDICADIQMVHWQMTPHDRLPETYRGMLKVLILIRSLRDTRVITAHDFGCICRYTGAMARHMMQWSNAYNGGDGISDGAAWAVMQGGGEPPGMYVAEEERNTDGTPVQEQTHTETTTGRRPGTVDAP